jgi:photosystem II stability/assembly factor-like uncharacterized protein
MSRLRLPQGLPRPGSSTNGAGFAEYQQPLSFGRFVILPTVDRTCTKSRDGATTCRGGLYALVSFDGGRSWTASHRVPAQVTNQAINPVWQVMTYRSWWSVVGSWLWSTNDSGQHWRRVHMQIPHGLRLLQIQFVSCSVGWAIGGRTSNAGSYAPQTALLHTTDGGHTWSLVTLPSSA